MGRIIHNRVETSITWLLQNNNWVDLKLLSSLPKKPLLRSVELMLFGGNWLRFACWKAKWSWVFPIFYDTTQYGQPVWLIFIESFFFFVSHTYISESPISIAPTLWDDAFDFVSVSLAMGRLILASHNFRAVALLLSTIHIHWIDAKIQFIFKYMYTNISNKLMLRK